MIDSTLPPISGEQATSELQSGPVNPLRCFTGKESFTSFVPFRYTDRIEEIKTTSIIWIQLKEVLSAVLGGWKKLVRPLNLWRMGTL
jgi:hypothetical protein